MSLTRSEVYFLLKLVEKAKVPPWINQSELIKKLQDEWIQAIHKKETSV